MKSFSLLLALVPLAFVSCERHEWNETKKLSEPHPHAAHAEEGHGEAHAEGEHAEKAEH